jgi:hypothetical protein
MLPIIVIFLSIIASSVVVVDMLENLIFYRKIRYWGIELLLIVGTALLWTWFYYLVK